MLDDGEVQDGAPHVYDLPADRHRSAALDEVHARPFPTIEAPRALIQLVFLGSDKTLGRTRPCAPYHGVSWDEGGLRCEKQGEFSTYLWSAMLDRSDGAPLGKDPLRGGFVPPGPVLCGMRLDVLAWSKETAALVERFDAATLCHSRVENGLAEIATDFCQDEDGLTRMVILDHGLAPARLSALAQHLLEIETYRTLALLNVPVLQEADPLLHKIEARLAEITSRMRIAAREDGEALLTQLADLSAELEANATATLFRLGASRGYNAILEERLSSLNESVIEGCYRWRDFLLRRIAPAMRTCGSVEERQSALSDKLARAMSLLRSWIDVRLERQNGALLASMNNRARQQLHLQHTVEGLSVAAISYYVVSLLAHVIDGLPGFDAVMPPGLAVAILTPVVALSVWWMVRRIRNAHGDPEAHGHIGDAS